MTNRSPVMVISRMVTSPVRMTTCFMGSMPADSPDWVMVILYRSFPPGRSFRRTPPNCRRSRSGSCSPPPRTNRRTGCCSPIPHGALLCRTCRLRGEILHCQGQEHCQYRSACQNPAADAGRTVPILVLPYVYLTSLPAGSSSALYAIISRRTAPAVVISSRSGLPAVSPPAESSSTRSITNRGRCLTSM